MKQKKLIFNFFVNRNWKKLTDSRKTAKILADNRKDHHPIETLLIELFYIGIPVVGTDGRSYGHVITKISRMDGLPILYYYMRNFCDLIGLEQWYFNLIWNTYRWKLQTVCGL